MPSSFKYNPSTGEFGIVGADGRISPIPANKVPSDVRTRTLARYKPSAAATLTTPEQRYEKAFGALPKALQWIAPSTIGEAGFGAGGLTAAGLGLLGAPETGGLSLALPLAGAVAGGALEDPEHRVKGAAYEGAKATGMLALGGLTGKAAELGGRLFKNTMLERTAQRIGQGIGTLLDKYPFASPKNAAELENQVASGRLTEATGKRLGDLRDYLKNIIPEYQSAEAPKLVEASSGVPFHYTSGRTASGRAFNLPDINSEGKRIARTFSIGDAIDHVRGLQAAGWSAAGSPKSAQEAWLIRQTAHDARLALMQQLDQFLPGLGQEYAKASGDYGVATALEDIFKNSYRPDGQIDQAKLLTKLRKDLPDIQRLKGSSRAEAFRASVSPTRAMAQPETPLVPRMRASFSEPTTHFHVPTPYRPETRAVIPTPFRQVSDPRLRAILGYLAGETGSEALGEK